MARFEPILHLNISRNEVLVENRKVRLLHRLAEAFQTVMMWRQFQMPCEHSNAFVPQSDQVFSRQLSRPHVVRADGVGSGSRW